MSDHNYLHTYENAVAGLRTAPDDVNLKHAAVLSLARAGSLDFACAEYVRYGLDKIRHHEDAMALGGRLFKDQALRSSGQDRKRFFQKATEKYEEAFKDTGGFYTGINAATMALLAGTPHEMVSDRAKTILRSLKKIEADSGEDAYYRKATEAEAQLLIGDDRNAADAMREALDADPLNFTAHASTIRQLRLILAAQNKPSGWTDWISPPNAGHFAGHLFGLAQKEGELNNLTRPAQKALKIEISDAIQMSDIGYGYGALAAGADILIAETLLEEGAELHVVLPVDRKSFSDISVAPYGDHWLKRYRKCIKHAHSVTTLVPDGAWPSGDLNEYASQTAMGMAAMRASTLYTQAWQILIWDNEPSSTGNDGVVWKNAGRPQTIIDYPGKRKKPAPKMPRQIEISAWLASDDGAEEKFASVEAAVDTALERQSNNNQNRRIGVHFGPASLGIEKANNLANNALPGGLYISQACAGNLHTFHSDRYICEFAGMAGDMRAFTVRKNEP